MFAFFGGGNSIPGVSSDNQTPGGEIIAGALQAGDSNAALIPSIHLIYGSAIFLDTLANQADSDDVADFAQTIGLTKDSVSSAINANRRGALNGHQYITALARFEDVTATTAPVLQVIKQGTTVLEITNQKSIVGALSLVTDANAKAVLTSIIATIVGIKVASNDTT